MNIYAQEAVVEAFESHFSFFSFLEQLFRITASSD